MSDGEGFENENYRSFHSGGEGEPGRSAYGSDVRGSEEKRPREVNVEEDEEEEDAEHREEEEEEEEEERRHRKTAKRAKHRHKQSALTNFIDLEAMVDEDDEDEDEEEDPYFVEPLPDGEEDDVNRHASHHARLDRQRELDTQDYEQIAQDFSKRYAKAPVRYTGDMNEVPQRLLMPSVHDANLWQVRVKPGRERDIVFSLMRKAIDLEDTARPLLILSAFQRDSLPGMIYVEARSSQQVVQACSGLVGVYPSRGISLVPIEEMASLLQIKKQDLTVTPGSWVRIKRGKYQGDLAQVMDITENGEDVGLKFIPRIDLNPRDDVGVDGRKRKKGAPGLATMRPPQRFFNYEEVIKVWGRKQVSKRNQVYVFQNDTYKDGFIEKDFKLSALVLENVNPTLDEITRFTRGQDGAENEHNVDLSIIAEASRKAAISVLQPGDHVEVFEGEQAGVHGVVQEIVQDVVTISAIGVDIDGQKVVLPARSVRKRFKPGDHVKVMTGQNADETGLVVSVADNIVTFLSDMSMQEISVFSKDLREAAEVGSGTNIVGNYELHDLVQLDMQTVGVIFKTERDSFRVLDQNGQIRLVQPHQIAMRRDSDRAIATDSEGHELRVNDNVKEIDGEGRKGRVLHTHQSYFAFLHNRDITENGGIFVTRARSLASLAPKGNVLKTNGVDLSKMNPTLGAPTGGMVGSGNMGRGPRDRDIGLTVVVVKGTHKGYSGTIKDTNGQIARVELRSGNKVITIDKEKIHELLPNNSLRPLNKRVHVNSMGPPGDSRTPSYGGRTPGGPNVGRTPNPYMNEGRTPAWNASSRTPNPYALDGGRTPAWNTSSRTPNPYVADGGRTPAWNAHSRTPNPYNAAASGSGGAGWGDAGTGGEWGAPKADNPWQQEGWGSDDWTAPTPAAAATPAFNMAATPAAATPMPSGFAEHSYVHDAQTPAGLSAPTPAAAFSMDDDTHAPHVMPRRSKADEPSTWLLDRAIMGKPCYVEVRGTFQTNYREGAYERKRGYVLSVFDPQTVLSTDAEQEAYVKIEGDEITTSFLLKYLVPVPPQSVKDRACVLNGERKGEVVIVQELTENGQCVVSAADAYQGAMFEILVDDLVKIKQ